MRDSGGGLRGIIFSHEAKTGSRYALQPMDNATVNRGQREREASGQEEVRQSPVRRPPLKALRAFEAAARLENFFLAADELNVTPSAVSYQIKLLETFLGISLFDRLNRGIALTDVGHQYYEAIRNIFAQIDSATQVAINTRQIQVLYLRVASSFSVKWLMPRLSSFLHQHPDVHLKLDTRSSLPFGQADPADIEIRFGGGKISDMHVEPLITESFAPMCSPSLVEGANAIKTINDLAKFRLIHSRANLVPWSTWLNAHGMAELGDSGALVFDRAFMAIDAAVKGLGIVLEGDFLARQELATGLLIEPFKGIQKQLQTCRHFLVYPHGRAEVPKIKAFVTWIKNEIESASLCQ